MSFWKKIITKEVGDLLGIAGTIGLHMVSGAFVGLAIGYYLDRWLETKPWFTLGMLVIGVIAGFKNVYDDARRIQRQDLAENPEPPHLTKAGQTGETGKAGEPSQPSTVAGDGRAENGQAKSGK